MTQKAADYLIWDESAGVYRENPEQAVRDDVEKHYWKHVGLTILKDWRLYLMLVPMLLVFLFWRYFPMYELLGCFKVSDTVLPVSEQLFSGFSYFKQLLVGGDSLSINFWRAMRNTFLLSFYGLCFGFPMPIILALFFNEVRSNAARSVYQVMTYLPKFMSTVVMTSLVTMLVKQGSLISQMGIVSQALVRLGLISEEVGNSGLLNNPGFFRAIYQISGIWEGAGYDSIVFFAAIIAISPTSYEAAQIDGANKWAQMRYVVLPSMLSTIVCCPAESQKSGRPPLSRHSFQWTAFPGEPSGRSALILPDTTPDACQLLNKVPRQPLPTQDDRQKQGYWSMLSNS